MVVGKRGEIAEIGVGRPARETEEERDVEAEEMGRRSEEKDEEDVWYSKGNSCLGTWMS